MAIPHSQRALICLLLFLFTVASAVDVRRMSIDEYVKYINPPPLYKFRNEHGDNILCVSYNDQISLRGSEQRWNDVKVEKSAPNFGSNEVKRECPGGTVAMRETKREDVERAGSVRRFLGDTNTRGDGDLDGATWIYVYAKSQILTELMLDGDVISGASGWLNVWQPHVDDETTIFSASLIRLQYDKDGLSESIAAGWMVSKTFYGDLETRLSTYWKANDTGDNITIRGCHDISCSGFVLASHAVNYLGAKLTPLSTYNGKQQETSIKIIKETPNNGTRWALYVQNNLLGWWPGSLFRNLSKNANIVEVGGEVFLKIDSPHYNLGKTEMGSGHFPNEGFGRSAYIRDIQITGDHGVPLEVFALMLPTNTSCYDVVPMARKDQTNNDIFFGGPGGNDPNCHY